MQDITDIKRVKAKTLKGDIVQGDKHVHTAAAPTLWDWTDEQLRNEFWRCNSKLAELKKQFNGPYLWLIIGFAIFIAGITTGFLNNIGLIFITFGLGIIFPVAWLANIDKNNKQSLLLYQSVIAEIKVIQDYRK